jgi:diguanylate cyclase (GGDEF)-like protein
METSVKKSLFNCLSDVIPILDNITAMQSAERSLHQIVEQLAKDVSCQSCAIVQIDPETEALHIRNSYNLSWTFSKNFRKHIVSPVLGELIWKGQAIYIPDSKFAETYKREIMLEREFGSAYAVQLIANSQPLGYFYIDSEAKDYFKTEQQLLIQMYARIISVCLFLERVTGRLKQLEMKDADTDALRYEVFYPVLQELMSRTQRLHEQLSVLILDVAGYGQIVKSHGVQIATILLREVVKAVKSHLRPYDQLCRFGADELLIALPGVEKSAAVRVAEKIYHLIIDSKFTELQLSIDAFIGIANYPVDSSSLESLLTAVRNALIIAKREDTKRHIAIVDESYE